jgi:hypothetical protein
MTVLVVVRNQEAEEGNGWVVFLDQRPRVREVCTLIQHLHAPEVHDNKIIWRSRGTAGDTAIKIS